MREILFRGKRIFDGNWVYGFAFKQYSAAKVEEWYIRAFETDYLVIPETIGQYTGLTDKNGTKIFEGDIVKEKVWKTLCVGAFKKADKISVVTFKKGMFSNCTQSMNNSEIEIIGNIYDNPELLEGGVDNG